MGGGQLGRMFAFAARRMGYYVHVFTPEENSPAGQVADFAMAAEYTNEGAVRRFARDLDLITFEFENIPIETIEWCAYHCEVRPAGHILHKAQNRLREKEFLTQAGIPVAQFRPVTSARELSSAIEQVGRPAILKGAAFGYDGKGQQMITSREDFDEIWNARSGDQLILEQAIDFAKEISVIVARDPDGGMATFPVCENIHRNHILDITVVPARVGEGAEKVAAEIARAIAEKLELVGVLAVEMFLGRDDDLIVNELAPRPHNSGHWTIEGCATSQFEQHVRAVCGLPLGSTEILQPTAMANLLGDIWRAGEPEWSRALEIEGVHLHLYGKHEPRPRRKMGHLTALAKTAEEAVARVSKARDALVRAAP